MFISDTSFSEPLRVSVFPAPSLEGWEDKEFNGSTLYQLSQIEGKQAILAVSQTSASAFIKKVHIDIKKYPILNWNWKSKID